MYVFLLAHKTRIGTVLHLCTVVSRMGLQFCPDIFLTRMRKVRILEFGIMTIKMFLFQEGISMQMVFDHIYSENHDFPFFPCPRNSTCNSSTFDESEEWQVAQDAEICLLKSGEIM